jgi:hypothetical protein
MHIGHCHTSNDEIIALIWLKYLTKRANIQYFASEPFATKATIFHLQPQRPNPALPYNMNLEN